MKKSLVITTIATVLVIVVALTTATFAWFSTSDTTTASGNFTVSTGGGDFRIYTWEKDQNQYGIDPVYMLDLTSYGSGYNFDTTAMGQTLGAESKINPSMPISTLDGVIKGMTAKNFMTGNQMPSSVNVTSITAKPVYAKFMLDTSLADTQLDITITIKSDSPTRNMINAINNLNFMLVGKSAVDSADTQSFVLGTTYSYYSDGDYETNTELAVGEIAQAEYDAEVKSQTVDEYATANLGGVTNIVKKDVKADLEEVSLATFQTGVDGQTNRVVLNSGAINMELGTEIECVLFLWFDGNEMTESASDGSFNFEISFGEVALP